MVGAGLLLAMVAVLYLERVITYLYFAPTVLSWQDTTPADTTPALLDEVRQWMLLNWARAPVDWFVLAVFMVVVIAYPRAAGGSHPAPARAAAPRRAAQAGSAWTLSRLVSSRCSRLP